MFKLVQQLLARIGLRRTKRSMEECPDSEVERQVAIGRQI